MHKSIVGAGLLRRTGMSSRSSKLGFTCSSVAYKPYSDWSAILRSIPVLLQSPSLYPITTLVSCHTMEFIYNILFAHNASDDVDVPSDQETSSGGNCVVAWPLQSGSVYLPPSLLHLGTHTITQIHVFRSFSNNKIRSLILGYRVLLSSSGLFHDHLLGSYHQDFH